MHHWFAGRAAARLADLVVIRRNVADERLGSLVHGNGAAQRRRDDLLLKGASIAAAAQRPALGQTLAVDALQRREHVVLVDHVSSLHVTAQA